MTEEKQQIKSDAQRELDKKFASLYAEIAIRSEEKFDAGCGRYKSLLQIFEAITEPHLVEKINKRLKRLRQHVMVEKKKYGNDFTKTYISTDLAERESEKKINQQSHKIFVCASPI